MRCSSRHATAKIARTRDCSTGHKSKDKLGTGSQTSSATKLSTIEDVRRGRTSTTSCRSLGLDLAVELLLLIGGLEATVPKLGRCVDELELDLLQGQP